MPSTHEGIIEKINIKVGDKVNKGDLILSLKAESATKEKKEEVIEQTKVEKTDIKEIKPQKQKEIIPVMPTSQSGSKSATPTVRKFARE